MKLKDFIKAWDGFSPLWINIETKEGIRDCQRVTRKSKIYKMFDEWEVTYITLDGDGELTVEVLES